MGFKKFFPYLSGLLMLAVAGSSQAVLTTYTDRTTWSSLGINLYTEDFESYVADTSFEVVPLDVGPFTLSTVGTAVPTTNKIDVSPFEPSDPPPSFGNATVDIFVDDRDPDPVAVDLTFDTPVSGFFADFWAAGNTSELVLTLSLLGGGTTDLNVPGPGNSAESFGFFSTSDLITSIRFNNELNDGFKMDNVSASVVPVPAAVWLFGTALIGLFGYGRRKSLGKT